MNGITNKVVHTVLYRPVLVHRRSNSVSGCFSAFTGGSGQYQSVLGVPAV